MDEKIKNLHLPRELEEELRRAAARPTWESSNEGVHERVNFDDTIWGFHLAGGVYYKTPLRITYVKEGSRAERAGIKAGDVLSSINGIETVTLTLERAHDMIVESGLEIKLNVTAPDVEETTYSVYVDEFAEKMKESKRQQSLNARKVHKKFNGAKTNDAWSSVWPCSKKRDVMYRESNCFLVPSRFEQKHPEKLVQFEEEKKIEQLITEDKPTTTEQVEM